jgi:rRNA maturation RNase YbeY
MGVLIQNQQRVLEIDLSEIKSKAQKTLKILGLMKKELSILLADEPTIAELNAKYLHRPGPTNVIAFPMQEGPYSEINPHILGDIVISVETAKRQAKEAGLPFDRYLEKLLVHGILHLIGYDHEGPDVEAHVMEEKEHQVLQALWGEKTASPPKTFREEVQ